MPSSLKRVLKSIRGKSKKRSRSRRTKRSRARSRRTKRSRARSTPRRRKKRSTSRRRRRPSSTSRRRSRRSTSSSRRRRSSSRRRRRSSSRRRRRRRYGSSRRRHLYIVHTPPLHKAFKKKSSVFTLPSHMSATKKHVTKVGCARHGRENTCVTDPNCGWTGDGRCKHRGGNMFVQGPSLPPSSR
jgi:hypothetical protein